MSIYEVNNLYKSYAGKTEAVLTLEDINLEVKEKEFVCLLGPSGCGKSTLLQLLAGLLHPSEGAVRFKGELHTEPNTHIGFVFQDASLYPWKTIESNVGIGLEFAHVKRKERQKKVRPYLEMVGLEDFAKSYPHQLSGGMKQRAGIARALVNDPDVLLMDEPFGALDHLTRRDMQEDLLRIWAQSKKTVVFVTHDVSEAAFLADRIILLSPRPGRIVQEFDVPFERPRNHSDLQLTELENKVYEKIHQFQL